MLRSIIRLAFFSTLIFVTTLTQACPPERPYASRATARARASSGSRAIVIAKSGPSGPAVARGEAHNNSEVRVEADSRADQQSQLTFGGFAVCVKDRAGRLWLADLLGDADVANELVDVLRGEGKTAWAAEFYRLNPRSTSYSMSTGDAVVGLAIQRGPGESKVFAVGEGSQERPSLVELAGTIPNRQ